VLALNGFDDGSDSSQLCWSSTIVETLDEYPYGGQRIDNKVGGNVGEKNKYAGTQYDGVSGLNYAQARYQNPSAGQFLSEDPVFLGDPRQQVLAGLQRHRSVGQLK
jgi:RHS repeat-associated protein